ncbi:unnamed protein product [Mytilus coruscus]|uniref:Uncharacterized protein n=1 Tax=Mytilus coruscus TaxID=42192 RepID=A0A6J8D5M7_MYTCO|nr:unnamed protein product [Mytilus coruscus]
MVAADSQSDSFVNSKKQKKGRKRSLEKEQDLQLYKRLKNGENLDRNEKQKDDLRKMEHDSVDENDQFDQVSEYDSYSDVADEHEEMGLVLDTSACFDFMQGVISRTTDSATVRFRYCALDSRSSCYNVSNINDMTNEPSGIQQAFIGRLPALIRKGILLGQPQERMVYYIILSILACVQCGVLAEDDIQCKKCADLNNNTAAGNTTILSETCPSAQPTPCNGTALGCREFIGIVLLKKEQASGLITCNNVIITNVGSDRSGFLDAFLARVTDLVRHGIGLGAFKGIDGQICK